MNWNIWNCEPKINLFSLRLIIFSPWDWLSFLLEIDYLRYFATETENWIPHLLRVGNWHAGGLLGSTLTVILVDRRRGRGKEQDLGRGRKSAVMQSPQDLGGPAWNSKTEIIQRYPKLRQRNWAFGLLCWWVLVCRQPCGNSLSSRHSPRKDHWGHLSAGVCPASRQISPLFP
jgi:hypothetical protein